MENQGDHVLGIQVKTFKVSNLFSVLWGLLGLWTLLWGLFYSIYFGRSAIWVIFLSIASLVLIYLLITGKSRWKTEFTTRDLILRGTLIFLMLIIAGMMAAFVASMRILLIIYIAVAVVLLVLMGFQLAQAIKDEGTKDPAKE